MVETGARTSKAAIIFINGKKESTQNEWIGNLSREIKTQMEILEFEDLHERPRDVDQC